LRKSRISVALICLKMAVTIAAFYFIARVVDPRKLWVSAKATRPQYLLMALAIAIVQVPIVGVRWHRIVAILSANGAIVPDTLKIQQIAWISQFFSQVLPFAFADATRMILLRNAGSTLRVAVKSALLDRAVALLVVLLMALPAVLLSPLIAGAPAYSTPIRILVAAGLTGSVGAVLVAPTLARVLAGSRLAPIFEVLIDLRRIASNASALVTVGGLCLLVHLISMVAFWLLAMGQRLPVGLSDAAAIVPLLVLVATVPVAVAGWGLREAFLLALLSAAGVAGEKALLLSMSFGSVFLVASLPGVAAIPFVDRVFVARGEAPESSN